MSRTLTVEVHDGDSLTNLHELAANNDADGFRRCLEQNPGAVDEVGLWYGRSNGSSRMALELRTPLMVAAAYGSLDVLGLILSLSAMDVGRGCGPDNTTALHCAASGGSENSVEAVKMLLEGGANVDSVDAHGHRPADVVVVTPKLPDIRVTLQELLGIPKTRVAEANHDYGAMRLMMNSKSNTISPPTSVDDDGPPFSSATMTTKLSNLPRVTVSEKKEYPVDPSLPDIKNSIFATDEFRMYSFKIRPCSRAYSHDWTECPFVHPGENARRRDPRKYHYSCVPCPDFRKGVCRRGDMCEYAHGVFECWLHPAQYRTRLCKDGTSCARRVCFFAHTNEELRPLYVSTGSAVPSPRSATSVAMEMAVAMGLMPGSPSSLSTVMSPFTPPMSPLTNGMAHSSLAWPQPSIPALHLPGSNPQSSRLRSTLNARDVSVDDFSMLPDFDPHLLNDLGYSRLSSSAKNLAPSNLDGLFSAEISEISSSPRYDSDQGSVFSPSSKAAILHQFQQQQQQQQQKQSMLASINTNLFSPKALDAQQLPGHSSLLQASPGISLPNRMSPRSIDHASTLNSHLSALLQHEKQQQTLRSLSSRDLGSGASRNVGSPVNSLWSKWGLPSGTVDWEVNGEELGKLRRSSSFEMRSGGEDQDLSWVHSLVRDSPEKPVATATTTPTSSNLNAQLDGHDQTAVLGALLEQMQLDQMVI